jgi:hypothetical protein
MKDFNIDAAKVAEHVGHKIIISVYGGAELTIECNTCYEVIASIPYKIPVTFDVDDSKERKPSCNMDEGCVSCGS